MSAYPSSDAIDRNPLSERRTRVEIEGVIRDIHNRAERMSERMRENDARQMRWETRRLVDHAMDVLGMLER